MAFALQQLPLGPSPRVMLGPAEAPVVGDHTIPRCRFPRGIIPACQQEGHLARDHIEEGTDIGKGGDPSLGDGSRDLHDLAMDSSERLGLCHFKYLGVLARSA